MKVLFLANNDVGLYKFRKEIIEVLLKANYEVYISLPEGDYIDALRQMGCKYIKTEFERRGTNPFKDLRLLCFYWKLMKRVKPDVVLTYTIKPNIYGGIVCRLKKIPYLANITGLGTAIENHGFVSQILLQLYGFSVRKAKRVFFQNAENKKFFEDRKLVKSNAKMIPGSGVNLEEHCYEEYPVNDNVIRLLFIGRIMKDKGIGEFLDCAEAIRKERRDVEFDILGAFDEETYKTRMIELEKNHIVTYYGQQDDVHSFIRSHHATVLPSYHEGLSNVLLESAATGRPVLASNIAGCKEIFEEGISGMGFPPKDSKSLTETVLKFINLSYNEKVSMGIQARKKVEKEFDRNMVVKVYRDEIMDVKEKKNNVQ